mmetsp:Transcript_20835/g.45357  ORF Transcript_20835/g.45357 Transcript_20835/m.45357 type:complete len:284 (-) Transcript_20835:756-1607(-)
MRLEHRIERDLQQRRRCRSRRLEYLQSFRNLLRRFRSPGRHGQCYQVFGPAIRSSRWRTPKKLVHAFRRRRRLAHYESGRWSGFPDCGRGTNSVPGSSVPSALHRRGWLWWKGSLETPEQRRCRRKAGSIRNWHLQRIRQCFVGGGGTHRNAFPARPQSPLFRSAFGRSRSRYDDPSVGDPLGVARTRKNHHCQSFPATAPGVGGTIPRCGYRNQIDGRPLGCCWTIGHCLHRYFVHGLRHRPRKDGSERACGWTPYYACGYFRSKKYWRGLQERSERKGLQR